MNLIKLAMDKVFGKGTSKSAIRRRTDWRNRAFEPGTRNAAVSRQTIRATLRDREYAKQSVPSEAVGNNSWQPLPRKERRQLARAFAAKQWRAQKTATAMEATA